MRNENTLKWDNENENIDGTVEVNEVDDKHHERDETHDIDKDLVPNVIGEMVRPDSQDITENTEWERQRLLFVYRWHRSLNEKGLI